MSRIIKNPSVISGGIIYSSYENVTITANTDNLSITNIASNVLIRINATGNFNLTGIINPDGLGREIKVFNVGSNNIILKNNDAGSTAINRFQNGADKTLQAGEGIAMIYDVVDFRWKAFGVNI
jgi:hypothetical protein